MSACIQAVTGMHTTRLSVKCHACLHWTVCGTAWPDAGRGKQSMAEAIEVITEQECHWDSKAAR